MAATGKDELRTLGQALREDLGHRRAPVADGIGGRAGASDDVMGIGEQGSGDFDLLGRGARGARMPQGGHVEREAEFGLEKLARGLGEFVHVGLEARRRVNEDGFRLLRRSIP